ncbi:hypothetical protein [Dactylosporangium salmoneum]
MRDGMRLHANTFGLPADAAVSRELLLHSLSDVLNELSLDNRPSHGIAS